MLSEAGTQMPRLSVTLRREGRERVGEVKSGGLLTAEGLRGLQLCPSRSQCCALGGRLPRGCASAPGAAEPGTRSPRSSVVPMLVVVDFAVICCSLQQFSMKKNPDIF